MSGTYPPALRSVFKAVPCLVMCLAASYVMWIYNYSIIRHPHDHVPRPSYKSTRLEHYLRMRDEKIRSEYELLINYDPNQKFLHL